MPTLMTYVCIISSFLVVLTGMKRWINVTKKIGFVGTDMNKFSKVKIPEAGGLPLIFGFIVGYFMYVSVLVFIYNVDAEKILFSFAAASTILLAAFIGFIDDVMGWRTGLRQSTKFLLTLLTPLPIAVLNAGTSIMEIPFYGSINFGLIFPLVLIPIAIIGTTNGFNILAGYNGLEAGLGIIIVSTLGYLSYLQGQSHMAVLCVIMVVSLLAFLWYNKYPAKVFPGDTLTYGVGALIGVVAIISNIEKFALILFIPYFFELLLKSKGKLKIASWATASKNGVLKNKYGKWYGLPNVAISLLRKLKGKAYEWEVVFLILLFELACASIALLSYFRILPI